MGYDLVMSSVGSKQQRTYTSGHFSLELDGTEAGMLNTVDGGNFKSEAIGEQVGGENLVTRYPGRQKFEDITFQVGSAMSTGFWAWVKDSIDGKPSRRNGAIVARDFDGNERTRRTFLDALISEVQFPELDLNSKTPLLLTVKIAPEQLSYKAKDAAKEQTGPGDVRTQKKSVPRNFGFQMEGFDSAATRRVVKIDAFSVKQQVIDNPVGGQLYARKEVGRIEFPTLTLRVPEAYVAPWVSWWEKFVGEGEHVQKNERTGSISLLSSNNGETLLTLSLYGVGITGVSFDKHEAGADGIRNAKVELYVESIALK